MMKCNQTIRGDIVLRNYVYVLCFKSVLVTSYDFYHVHVHTCICTKQL